MWIIILLINNDQYCDHFHSPLIATLIYQSLAKIVRLSLNEYAIVLKFRVTRIWLTPRQSVKLDQCPFFSCAWFIHTQTYFIITSTRKVEKSLLNFPASTEFHLTHHSLFVHLFRYVWHMGLKLNTQLNESCNYHNSKYYIVILQHS